MRERSSKKSGRAAGQIFMGKKSLAGGTLWVRELHTFFLLGTRYARERQRDFIFIFTFTFIYLFLYMFIF